MHKALIRERSAATLAAIVMLALIPLPFPAELTGVAVLVLAYSRLGLPCVSQHALRMLELTITLTVRTSSSFCCSRLCRWSRGTQA